jgi:hypothetical protein
MENSTMEIFLIPSTGTGPSGTGTEWTKRCESAHCIEVALGDKEVGIRSASTLSGQEVWATQEEWDQFVADVKAGKFDSAPS